jgi:hypothetical protein
MAHQAPSPRSPNLVDIGVVARLGVELGDPGDLVVLFGEMGLHQAVGVLGPERAERFELRAVEVGAKRGVMT